MLLFFSSFFFFSKKKIIHDFNRLSKRKILVATQKFMKNVPAFYFYLIVLCWKEKSKKNVKENWDLNWQCDCIFIYKIYYRYALRGIWTI